MATRHMTAGAIRPIVDRTGRDSSEFQFVREAYQNAVEARATKVRVRWEQGASRLGTYRFEIADDGLSMSRQELPNFINKFGGGGKPIGGEHENFGVGLKSTTLPWNHAGVLVAARRDGETNLIHLHLDEEASEYGLRQWEVEDQDGNVELVDVLTLAAQVDGKWTTCVDRDFEPVNGTRVRDLLDAFLDGEQGTVIILCGNTGAEDTFLARGGGGEMGGEAPITGIATYLSRRYDELPVPASVEEPKSMDKTEWPRSPDEFARSHINVAGNRAFKVKTRNCRGVGTFLREGGEHGAKRPAHQGMVELSDGTKAFWFLLPEGDSYDSKGVGGVYWTPTIAVRYRGEIYAWGSSRQRLRDFGISRAKVIDRCTVILEPPVNNGGVGVYPDSTRSRLVWTGGRNLPWRQWANEFAKGMPAAIQEALDRATAELGRSESNDELSETQKKRLNALTRRLASSWRRPARAKDDPARVRIIPVVKVATGGRGGGGSDVQVDLHVRKRVKPDQASGATEARYVEDSRGEPIPTVAVKRPDRIPECRWFEPAEFDEPALIARWSAAEYVVEANSGCPIIRDSIEYWTSQFPAVSADDVARAVQRVYALKLRTVVAHMHTAKQRGYITADDLEKSLTPLSLTAAAAGFVIEDFALSGDIGALEGKARSKAQPVIST